MCAIVIPARNESDRLIVLLNRLLRLAHFEDIYVVINGCTDNTYAQVQHLQHQVNMIVYEEPLGYDIPRAIGALYAFSKGCKGVIFIDGDMTGDFTSNLLQIEQALQSGVDLALTNCYPYIVQRHPLAKKTIGFRQKLNKTLGLYHTIGIATPSHGLVGVSHRLATAISYQDFAVPPLSLALAKKNNLKIQVCTAISHYELGSKVRHVGHAKKIADTIIGDCLFTKAVYLDLPPNRIFDGKEYLGYHLDRRFDILSTAIQKKTF